MAETTSPRNQDHSEGKAQQTVGFVALLLLLGVVVIAIVEAFPHHVRNATNPNFVDNIIANSVVIFAIRLALLFGVVYVAISVVGLVGGRRWLSQLGPFRASEPIAQLDHSATLLQSELEGADGTIHDLERRLGESDRDLAQAQSDIEFLLDQIDTIEAEKEGT